MREYNRRDVCMYYIQRTVNTLFTQQKAYIYTHISVHAYV